MDPWRGSRRTQAARFRSPGPRKNRVALQLRHGTLGARERARAALLIRTRRPRRLETVADDALVLGLLNTLERELLPAIERGEGQAWGRANRVADAVLALLPEDDREGTNLPQQRVGALQALY